MFLNFHKKHKVFFLHLWLNASLLIQRGERWPKILFIPTLCKISEVAYGQKMAKSLHASSKHQIWYMHMQFRTLGQHIIPFTPSVLSNRVLPFLSFPLPSLFLAKSSTLEVWDRTSILTQFRVLWSYNLAFCNRNSCEICHKHSTIFVASSIVKRTSLKDFKP